MAPSKPAYEEFISQRYFSSLDGLRCLSIVMVIWHHSMAGGASGYRSRGYLGVELFFVISGFLITTLLLREREQTGRIALGHFYIRRTLRIFPLYYAVLGLYVILVLAITPKTAEDNQAHDTFLSNLPYYLTYTSNWFVNLDSGPRVIFYFAWSLATEEQFYLLWPWVLRGSRRWGLPIIVAAALIVLDQSTEHLMNDGLIARSNLLARIITSTATPILLGCILAYVLQRRGSFQAAYRFLGARWSAPLGMALLIVSILRPEVPHLAIYCLMTWVVGACCIREDQWLKPVLAHPIARYIGGISYGMYLLHMLALNMAKKVAPEQSLLLFPTALAVTIVAASISFRIYEQPFLKLKNWFRTQPQSPGQAAEPEVPALLGMDALKPAAEQEQGPGQ